MSALGCPDLQSGLELVSIDHIICTFVHQLEIFPYLVGHPTSLSVDFFGWGGIIVDAQFGVGVVISPILVAYWVTCSFWVQDLTDDEIDYVVEVEQRHHRFGPRRPIVLFVL